MTRNGFVNAPPFSGTPVTAVQTSAREKEEGGLDSIMRGILGHAYEPIGGLLSLFDPREIYRGLEESGQYLKEGVTEVDPKKLLLGALGTATIGAESTPFGRGVKTIGGAIKLKRQSDVPPPETTEDLTALAEEYGMTSEELRKAKNVLTPPEKPIETAKTVLRGRKDKDEYLLDQSGDPVVVYHSTDSGDPFPRFLTRAQRNELHKDTDHDPQLSVDYDPEGYKFASTSSIPESASRYGLTSGLGINTLRHKKLLDAGYTEEEIAKGLRRGARLIPALIKSNKVFDFENPKHRKRILERHDQNIKKELVDIERVSKEGTSASEKLSVLLRDISPIHRELIRRKVDSGFKVTAMASELDRTGKITSKTRKAKTIFDENNNILSEFENNTDVLESLDVFLTQNSKNLGARIHGKQYRKEIKGGLIHGDYSEIEDKHILKAMQDLGFDAFTTLEEGAKNVMLFKPDTQLIPLFDIDKKSAVGFNKGGSIVERNPYEDYSPRMI